MIRFVIVFLIGCGTVQAQNSLFNSAYKGNLSLEVGMSSNQYAKSSLSMMGNEFSFTLNDATFIQPIDGIPSPNMRDLLSNQYRIAIGYTVKRGVQLQLNLDNFQYQLANQRLNIDGYVTPGFDIIGGLAGTFNSTSVEIDTIGFRFSSNSTKLISMNLNLLQNLYRTKSRMFVLNAIYGIGLGALHTTSSVTFGPAYQNERSGMSGFAAMAQGGIRVEFLRHFYILPKLSAGILVQNNIGLDVSDATQKATHTLWVGQMSLNVGTVFFLGKQKNCDCPHF